MSYLIWPPSGRSITISLRLVPSSHAHRAVMFHELLVLLPKLPDSRLLLEAAKAGSLLGRSQCGRVLGTTTHVKSRSLVWKISS